MEDQRLEKIYSIWYDLPQKSLNNHEKGRFLSDFKNKVEKKEDILKLFCMALTLDEKRILDVHGEKITHVNYGEGKIIYIIKKSNETAYEVAFQPNKKEPKIEIEFDCYNYNKLKEQWSNLKLPYLTVYYKKKILKYLEPKKNHPESKKNHTKPKKKEKPLLNLLDIEKKESELENKGLFIKNKLQTIFSEFKKEVNSRYKLCELNNLFYRNGNIPDYNNAFIQQYYLLRYYYAYFYEYYMIYKKILSEDFINPPYDILSIGSGSYIDYSAFKFALIETKKNHKEDFFYSGLDRINWRYKPKDYNIFFDHRDIYKRKRIIDHSEANIFIFPRSFSELRDEFINKINLNENKRDKIVFIAAHVESPKNLEVKKGQKRFYNLLKNKINDNFNIINTLEDSIYNFKSNLSNKYPEYIKEFLTSLSNNCKNKQSCYNDKCMIEYNPRLNIDSISQIIMLEKELYPKEYSFDFPF
ncbi:MAG: hypothetical protein ACOCRX_11355 [Candidatus Woesearchaeota archaeon]